MSVFGSTLMGTAKPDNDLDLLVEFEPHPEPCLIGMARIEIELSCLLGGRVDLRTAEALSRHFHDEIILHTATITPIGGWNRPPVGSGPNRHEGSPFRASEPIPPRPT